MGRTVTLTRADVLACWDCIPEWRTSDTSVEARGNTLSVFKRDGGGFLPLNIRVLMKLAELLGTDDFDCELTARQGSCETCDYGSERRHDFEIGGIDAVVLVPEPS